MLAASGTSAALAATNSAADIAAACAVTTIPQETAGPYPADGSQASNGNLNALALSGIVRRDIRTSLGTGYLRFALAEPGLFRTAFAVPEAVPGQGGVSGAGDSGLPPFQLLAAALDSLVAAGTLPPDRRPDAEYPAWTAVHGLDEPQLAAIGQRLLDMVERGL